MEEQQEYVVKLKSETKTCGHWDYKIKWSFGRCFEICCDCGRKVRRTDMEKEIE